MRILILAEHDNEALRPVTLNVVAAARAIGGDYDILVAGRACGTVAEAAARIDGARKVLVADHEAYEHALAENVAPLVAELGGDYDRILGAHTTTGKNVPAAGRRVARHANGIGHYRRGDRRHVPPPHLRRQRHRHRALSRTPPWWRRCAAPASTRRRQPMATPPSSRWTARTTPGCRVSSARKSPGPSARNLPPRPSLFPADRGMQSGENFALLEGVADKLGAAIGAFPGGGGRGLRAQRHAGGANGQRSSRPIFTSRLAFSGAIQHLAGMKDSKVIVAINRDEDAPIFQVADYGLVADLFEALPELERALGQ